MSATERKVRLTRAQREVRPYTPSYGLFGVLNPSGQFWSHQTFFTPDEARRYIASFWKGRPVAELEKFKIVPVRVTLELDDPAGRQALSPEREGQ